MKRRKDNRAKNKIENWLCSDVRLPYSVCMTFLVLVILSGVFVFGELIASEIAGDNADDVLSPHELFLTIVFLILFVLFLIGMSYIPHGIYIICKKITGHSRELKKIKRFTMKRYILVYPFATLGILLLFTALLMLYADLYNMGVFNMDAGMTVSIITIVVIYGIIFGITAHYLWILLRKSQKQKNSQKKSV